MDEVWQQGGQQGPIGFLEAETAAHGDEIGFPLRLAMANGPIRRFRRAAGHARRTGQRKGWRGRNQQEIAPGQPARRGMVEGQPGFPVEHKGEARCVMSAIAHAPIPPAGNRLGNGRLRADEADDIAERVHFWMI